MLIRNTHNPLLIPAQVRPSRPDFEVIGTFNAGVTTFNDDIVMLVRVAERPHNESTDTIACPYIDSEGMLTIKTIHRDDSSYDTSDSRKVEHRQSGELWLTSISHLRLARSSDGVHFTADDEPWLAPASTYERFGVEDARITHIDGRYFVNYTAVSPLGIATGLAVTDDFVHVERCGIIFPPSNRDVALFPHKINGMYWCYHRPMPGMFGAMNIWAASSPDLIRWGDHQMVLEASRDGWENGRVGGGAPPIWTERGWLSIYHAADKNDRYCLGAFLAAHDDPAQVLARSQLPILSPEYDYEKYGFFRDVVFTCGALLINHRLLIYYGAADERMALAEVDVNSLLDSLE